MAKAAVAATAWASILRSISQLVGATKYRDKKVTPGEFPLNMHANFGVLLAIAPVSF
jgi:hypothetical protein